MNAEVYADFLRRIGHKVVRTHSAYWFNTFRGSLIAFPYHRPISPSNDELKQLSRKAVLLRFVSETVGEESYYMACDQKPFTLGALTSKSRNQTRRGLEQCRVTSEDCIWLAQHGGALNRETLARQGRLSSDFSSTRWRDTCLAAAKYPGFEAWAAVSEGKVAAVAMSFCMGEVAYILLQRSAPSILGTYPNNALTFTITQQLLARSEIQMVFYGLRPLIASASLDHFKTGMGYRRFMVRESFWIAPLMRPCLRAVRFAISGFHRCARRNEKLRKFAMVFERISEEKTSSTGC